MTKTKPTIARYTALTIWNYSKNAPFTVEDLAKPISHEYPDREVRAAIGSFLHRAAIAKVISYRKHKGANRTMHQYFFASNAQREHFRDWVRSLQKKSLCDPYTKGKNTSSPTTAPNEPPLHFPTETITIELTLRGPSQKLASLIFDLMNQPQVLGVAVKPPNLTEHSS